MRPKLWWGPAFMVLFNLGYAWLSWRAEGRVRGKQLIFAWNYAVSVLPAMRGDVEPFIAVASIPWT